MPSKRKRKSFEQLDALSKGRNKRTEEGETKPEYSESTEFSFMKNEGGRPHKKKKKSIGRALAKRWDNKIPDYALNDLEAAHKRLIRMRGCRSMGRDHGTVYPCSCINHLIFKSKKFLKYLFIH